MKNNGISMNKLFSNRLIIGLAITLMAINNTIGQTPKCLDPDPIASIGGVSANQDVCVGQTLTFTNTSQNFTDVVSFRLCRIFDMSNNNWKGLCETNQTGNFSHTFIVPGDYKIKIVVQNSCGVTKATEINFKVHDVPVVGITPDSPTICSGAPVVLTAALTASGKVDYLWSTTETTKEIKVKPTVTTTYTLTLTNMEGCSNTASALVTVQKGAPVASIEISPTPDFCVGETVTFTNTSQNFTDVVAFQLCRKINVNLGNWKFNNTCEPNHTENSFSHTFLTPGLYKIGIEVQNACGVMKTTATTFWVKAAPVVSIDPANTTICSGESVVLTAASDASGTVNYLWNTTEAGNTITVKPTTTTTYTVIGTNAEGCANTASALVTVHYNSSPVASIGISDNPDFCVGETVTFTNTSQNFTDVVAFQLCKKINVYYNWSGNTMCQANHIDNSFSTTFFTPGNYKISITVRNACGVEQTTLKTFWVYDVPTVSIDPANATICSGASVKLTASGATNYSWSTSETGKNITVNPTAATTYTVTGTNSKGCSSSASTTISLSDLALECWAELTSNGSGIRFASKASGGSAPYTFSFNGIRVFLDYSTAAISGNFTNTTGETAYSNWYDYMPGFDGKFEVTDSKGCTQTCEILNYQAPIGTSFTTSCSFSTFTSGGINYISYNSSASGGSGNYGYIWKFSCLTGSPGECDYFVSGNVITWELDGTWCPNDYTTSVAITDLNSGESQTCMLTGLACKTGSSITLAELIANNASKDNTIVTSEFSDFRLDIYPNPAFDKINIDYHSNGHANLSYQITDITGKLLKENILSGNEVKTNINISDLSKGIYLLNLRENDRILTIKKLIKY